MKTQIGGWCMSYKIGSFNCLNFAMASSKDVQVFVDLILDEQFDIIALQEIKGQSALNRILNRLPENWKGIADDDPRVNDYAFIWNTRRIELAHTENYSSDVKTIPDRTYSPRIYKQYKIDRKNGQTDLIREPYFARFFPCGGCSPFIELRIINTHIRFSKSTNDILNNSIGAVLMRKNEFDVLTKSIYSKEADKRYGNNRPAYTILLGDYNLNMPSSTASSPYLLESFEIIDEKSMKIITTVQSELTTLKKSDDSEKINNYFANNYDHFTFDAARFSNVVVSCRRINTVEKYCKGEPEKHIKEISDHVPVVMNIDLK